MFQRNEYEGGSHSESELLENSENLDTAKRKARGELFVCSIYFYSFLDLKVKKEKNKMYSKYYSHEL